MSQYLSVSWRGGVRYHGVGGSQRGRTQESNRSIFTRDNLRPPEAPSDGEREKERWTDGWMAHFGRSSAPSPAQRQVCCAARRRRQRRWHKPQTASERRGSGWQAMRRRGGRKEGWRERSRREGGSALWAWCGCRRRRRHRLPGEECVSLQREIYSYSLDSGELLVPCHRVTRWQRRWQPK